MRNFITNKLITFLSVGFVAACVLAPLEHVVIYGNQFQDAEQPLNDDKDASAAKPLQTNKAYQRACKDLLDAGFGIGSDDLERLLRSALPNQATISETQRWLKQLSSNNYEERKVATQQLISLPIIDMQAIDVAAKSKEPETRTRIQQILEARDSRLFEGKIVSACTIAAAHPEYNLIPLMMQASEHLDSPPVFKSMRRVIDAASRPEHESIFTNLLNSSRQDTRILALHGLNAVGSERALIELEKMLSGPNTQEKLETALVFLGREDKRGLTSLLELLESAESHLRRDALRWLNWYSRANLPFNTSRPADTQAEQLVAWQTWIKENWHAINLNRSTSDKPIPFGRLLVCEYGSGRIVEIDLDGKVLWETSLTNAFACKGLPNGHRLVGQYAQGTITEFDERGEAVWSLDGLSKSISGIDRSETGLTLLACGQDENRLFEIDSDGKVVWEHQVEGNPVGVSYLEPDLFLVALYNVNEVVELDREGNILWRIAVDGQPYQAIRLESGNTLVRFSGANAAEYDINGNKVWEYEIGGAGYAIQRLSDATTIIADNQGVYLLDENSESKPLFEMSGYIYFHYY
ncbi:MAG TPA: PQQ-binding-like beta-propeller repeat protein [Pirellulaceae bacterium]|nr:PQQ-binding-like beta-propeller repeat protein [Pirellulaceae bacterium]HMO90797.1 PQQ-binding-like beta-propeller repeat protein [Pirellulaceae bacterium]HMP68048.1 PQQ-binding-like beta-propeller repeat protein [Pirellulaceae bacterium]